MLAGEPTESTFYEDYPLTSEAWLYNDPLADPHYEFEDPAKGYKPSLISGKEDGKKLLDRRVEEDLARANKDKSPPI